MTAACVRGHRRTPAPTVTPTDFMALANEPFTVRVTSPMSNAEFRFVDDGGRVVVPTAFMAVRDGGLTLEGESPILPDVEHDFPCWLEIRDRGGDWRRIPTPVVFHRAVPGDRTVDGSANHEVDLRRGSVGVHLRREVPDAYGDGIATPAGADRPSARAVSNAVCAQSGPTQNAARASDLFWLWGQFLDHDLDLTPEASPAEPFPVPVPTGDPWFDPRGTGQVTIAFKRSTYDPTTGTAPGNPRRQTNQITAWIDASNVYGSDELRASTLRTRDGTGRLRTSAGDLLPFNETGLPNAPSPDPSFFLAGDVRANEQVGLTAIHTLFVREHNRIAGELALHNPHLSGDQLYAEARRRVGALIQRITVREFLPVLLGGAGLPPYAGYDPDADGSIGVLFSTASYRFGHSMVSGLLLRLDAFGNPILQGHLHVRDAFFNPRLLIDEGGIDPVLRGFAAKVAQNLDLLVVDDLRNFLFGPPGSGGLDLASLNLQRGRDHGLPDYSTCRQAYGLAPITRFEDVSSDPGTVVRLATAYPTPGQIDPWVGGLAEDALPGALVGPFLHAVIREQLQRVRDGDRFWYQRVFSARLLDEIEATSLADVIRRNTGIGKEIQDDVMVVPATYARSATSSPPALRSGAATARLLDNRWFR